MATTVTYKGETLTTIRNDTKTLKTGGTWVEGDIGITDETSTAVVTVEDVPDTHGGIEKRITAVDISDTDATASDVAQGKVFYSNTGTRTVGTDKGMDWSAVALGDLPSGAITLNLNKQMAENKFQDCVNLTSVTFASVPNNMYLYGTFARCSNLAQVDLGNVYQLGNSVFAECTSLKVVRMNANPSRCNGSYTFQRSGVEEAYFPYMNYCTGRTFQEAHHIRIVDFGNVDMIRGNMFNSAESIRTLIIRKPTVPVLNAWDAATLGGIYQNPTESTIYVPQALISSYQTATNWSTGYAAGLTFLPIEGSEYEL